MYKIRGDKIAMIFQDPLSSLNPIVKIGKQITEAMMLKNKAGRKAAKREFNGTLATLRQAMGKAIGDEKKAAELCGIFDKFCIQANRLEISYNNAMAQIKGVEEAMADIKFLLSSILTEQYFLLMDNYAKYDQLRCNIKAEDNAVLDIIFRKVRTVIGTSPEPDNYEELVAAMRARLRG